MNYYLDKTTGELKQGFSALKNWIELPLEFQDKIFEDIISATWDRVRIICHPDLQPCVLRFNENIWSKMDSLKKGTKVLITDGRLSFHEPRPTPTEQRDRFQKAYPHLVVDCSKKHFKNFYPGTPVKDRPGILPKVIQDQLDVSPLHYRKGEIQPWDFIVSQKMGFLEGNIVKYITRYKHKNGIEDLRKAKTYLEKLISEVSCVKKSSE